jgi:hypothetical protein
MNFDKISELAQEQSEEASIIENKILSDEEEQEFEDKNEDDNIDETEDENKEKDKESSERFTKTRSGKF